MTPRLLGHTPRNLLALHQRHLQPRTGYQDHLSRHLCTYQVPTLRSHRARGYLQRQCLPLSLNFRLLGDSSRLSWASRHLQRSFQCL